MEALIPKNSSSIRKTTMIAGIIFTGLILILFRVPFQPQKGLLPLTTDNEKNVKDTSLPETKPKDVLPEKIKELNLLYKKNNELEAILDNLDTIESLLISVNKQTQDLQLSENIRKNLPKVHTLTFVSDEIKQEQQNIESAIKVQSGEIKKILNSTEVASFRFNIKDARYSCFIFDITDKKYDISFHLKNVQAQNYHSISNLYNHLAGQKDKDILMITNAGMFNPDYNPQGLFIERGNTIRNIDTSSIDNKTNFYMFPNGVFAIDTHHTPYVIQTSEYVNTNLKSIKFATQSGPMLVINGQIHPRFIKGSSNTNIRSGVGIPFDDNSRLLFIISDAEVNFYDFASVFKDFFGCKNALYLDGAISMLYSKDIHRNAVPKGSFGPMISVTRQK